MSTEKSAQNESAHSIEYEASLTLHQGVIKIIATAYNKMNTIESNPAQMTLQLGKVKTFKPHLHVLTIAVEKYRDRALQLKYTVDDAQTLILAPGHPGTIIFY